MVVAFGLGRIVSCSTINGQRRAPIRVIRIRELKHIYYQSKSLAGDAGDLIGRAEHGCARGADCRSLPVYASD